MQIAICVATYRRPTMLAALLDSLARLRFDDPSPALTLVVVDNEAAGTAQAVVDARRATLPFPVVTGIEPMRNIALARNRSVELAFACGAQWVAFVDDDEQVTPWWLSALLAVQRETGADAVSGPVVNRFVGGTPGWIASSGLPLRQRHARGTLLPGADTSNVLVARHVFDMVPGHFDARFGLTGGSDSHFFHRALRAGARIAWADDADVHETIPATRATAGWLLRRGFRLGNLGVHIARSLLPVRSWLPRRVAAAAYRMGRGVARLPAAVVRGRGALLAAAYDLSLGAGAIAALTGYRYVEYRRAHGE